MIYLNTMSTTGLAGLSYAHFAVHLLTNPSEKMFTITYFRDYCNRNYEKFICSQKTEDFTTQQMELDIQRMKYLVTHPFVPDDETDLAEIDLEKKASKKENSKAQNTKTKKINFKSRNIPKYRQKTKTSSGNLSPRTFGIPRKTTVL